MRNFIFSIIFFILFFMVFGLYSNEDNCCNKYPNKKCCDEFPWLEICKQDRENDNADDNFSYSTDNGNRLYFTTPGVLIYRKGNYKVYENSNFCENDNAFTDLKNSPEVLLNSGKVIIFPTGSLFGKDNDSTFKTILHEYVQKGGSIIVFCQQFGRFVDAVLPKNEGDVLRAYGWRESNSCTRDSSFFESFHPALASLTKVNANVGVDGYFASIPGNAIVLLRAAANKNPVLISYKYGQGTVILTSILKIAARKIYNSLNFPIPWVLTLNMMIKWQWILLAESGWEEKTCITMMENGISTREYVMSNA